MDHGHDQPDNDRDEGGQSPQPRHRRPGHRCDGAPARGRPAAHRRPRGGRRRRQLARHTVYDVYGVELRTDADGRFADSYDLADDVRALLTGWVKCTVQLWPQVPDAPIHTKVVRWMRPTSEELIAGLSALLADVRFARDSLNKK